MKIALFDLDGVLIKPVGYRKAYFDTCKWFIDQSKLKINLPGKDIPAFFESFGVTSEWDMLALSIGILLDSFCQQTGYIIQASALQDALYEISQQSFVKLEVDFRSGIQKVSPLFELNAIPSIAVYENCSSAHFAGLFKHPILEEILSHTRSVEDSLITAIFQNMVLGGTQFSLNYQTKAGINCESYLLQFDERLITLDWVKKIQSLCQEDGSQYAALTARPSLGPRDAGSDNQGEYSPEAELALDVIKMPEMILIGYGRLQYIGSEMGVIPDALIKPDAFHALAAIFAILVNNEHDGLQLARKILGNTKWVLPQVTCKGEHIKYPERLELAVFEDSQGGIRSLRDAVEILKAAGLTVETQYFGISQNIDKIKTLQHVGATIFPTINEALAAYIN